MSARRFSFFVSIFLLTIALSACISLAQDVTPPPGYRPPAFDEPLDPSEVFPLLAPNPETGQGIYMESCAPCHGEAGLGDGPQSTELPVAPPAIGTFEVAQQSTPAEWFLAVTVGNLDALMPPFGQSLSEGQRWDVLAYVYSLGVSQEELEQGQTLYIEHCAVCHGELGSGDGPEAAQLDTAPPDFTDQEFMAQRSGQQLFRAITEGVGLSMPGFDGLSEDQRWALVAQLRTLTFSTLDDVPALQAASPPDEVGEEELVEPVEEAVEAESAPVTAGEIHGQLIHGAGGAIPAGLNVELFGFDQMEQVVELSVPVEADGSFTFEDIETGHTLVYFATVEYEQMTYGSDFGVFTPGETRLDLPVTIFETTTDPSALVVSRLHIFFEFPAQDVMRVVQLYVVSNTSNETVIPVGPEQPTVQYSVPPDAANLTFQEGSLSDRYVITEDGFGDTLAILPGAGNYQILYAFDLAFEREAAFTQPLNLPVDAVVAFLPEGQASLRSDVLELSVTQDLGGVSYQTFTGGGVASGGELSMEVSMGGFGGGLLNVDIDAGLWFGAAAFALATAVAWYSLNRRRASAIIEAVEFATPEEVMDAIINLDDRYADGQVGEADYERRRAELKEILRDLVA